ncbi:MAG: hypothetical protein RL038_1121 [Actinomycetota bacterium]|jgi:hypothetical protein
MAEEVESPTQLALIKPEIEATGELSVDAALERLADVNDLPVVEHLEVFDDVHRRLQDVLSETHD